MSLLALLTVIPEECAQDRESLDRNRRRTFEEHMNAIGPEVMNVTYICITHSGTDSKLQNAVHSL